MVPWFEFYLPRNVMREPAALVLLEMVLWLGVLLVAGLAIAVTYERGRDVVQAAVAGFRTRSQALSPAPRHHPGPADPPPQIVPQAAETALGFPIPSLPYPWLLLLSNALTGTHLACSWRYPPVALIPDSDALSSRYRRLHR
jgi:hypothetical protein